MKKYDYRTRFVSIIHCPLFLNFRSPISVSLINYIYLIILYFCVFRTEIKLLPSIKVPIELYLIPFLVVFGVCFLFMAIFSVICLSYFVSVINDRKDLLNPKNFEGSKFSKVTVFIPKEWFPRRVRNHFGRAASSIIRQ